MKAGFAAREAIKRVEDSGLLMPSQPEGELPSVPYELDELDDRALMRLFAVLTGWCDYLAAQAAVAAIDERRAERDLEMSRAESMVRHAGSGKVTIARAASAADADVLEQQDRADRYRAYRSLVSVLASNAERDAALVSRELTRRTASSVSPARRSTRWSP